LLAKSLAFTEHGLVVILVLLKAEIGGFDCTLPVPKLEVGGGLIAVELLEHHVNLEQ
jgi:hypothetical protein